MVDSYLPVGIDLSCYSLDPLSWPSPEKNNCYCKVSVVEGLLEQLLAEAEDESWAYRSRVEGHYTWATS